MNFDSALFWDLLFSDLFLFPAWTTFWVTFVAMVGGSLLGFIAALGRSSSIWIFRAASSFYIWLFRGTPLVVQIIFWYNATSELTNYWINLPALVAGCIALSIHEGAYMTEIIRSGLLSVEDGQKEAARALGMRRLQVLWHVTIPQAVRIIIPPFANQYINMLKATSLLFTIGVPELFSTGTNLYSRNFQYFEVLMVVTIWYLLMTTLLSLVSNWLEQKFHMGPPAGSLRAILNVTK